MPTTDPLKRPNLTRTTWVDAQETEPHTWLVRIHARADDDVSTTTAVEWIETVDTSWAALDELDIALLSFGYLRSGDWETGQVAGYVAWIEPYGPRSAS